MQLPAEGQCRLLGIALAEVCRVQYDCLKASSRCNQISEAVVKNGFLNNCLQEAPPNVAWLLRTLLNPVRLNINYACGRRDRMPI